MSKIMEIAGRLEEIDPAEAGQRMEEIVLGLSDIVIEAIKAYQDLVELSDDEEGVIEDAIVGLIAFAKGPEQGQAVMDRIGELAETSVRILNDEVTLIAVFQDDTEVSITMYEGGIK